MKLNKFYRVMQEDGTYKIEWEKDEVEIVANNPKKTIIANKATPPMKKPATRKRKVAIKD